MSDTEKSGKGYKIAVIILTILVIGGLIAGIMYWQNQKDLQAQQQQQINALNQELDNTKTSIGEQAAEAKDKVIDDLNAKNEALQKKIDDAAAAATTPDTTN